MTDLIYTMCRSFLDLDNYKNFYIYSNNFIFNDQDVLIDMQMQVYSGVKDLILDNKNQTFGKTTLLFGDFMTDLAMAKNIGQKTLISIGFLDKKKINLLPEYLEGFDLVLAGSGDMIIHNLIIKYIEGEDVTNIIQEQIPTQDLRETLLGIFKS